VREIPCRQGKIREKISSGRKSIPRAARKRISIRYLNIRLSDFRQRMAGENFSLPSA